MITNIEGRTDVIEFLADRINNGGDLWRPAPGSLRNPRLVQIGVMGASREIHADPDSGFVRFYNANAVLAHEERNPGLANRLTAFALTTLPKKGDEKIFADFRADEETFQTMTFLKSLEAPTPITQ